MAAAAPKIISREVFVHIIVDPKADEPVRVDPGRFWVSKKGNQEVMWHCTSTDPKDPHPAFTVKFDKKKVEKEDEKKYEKGSPFYEREFDREHPCSGLVKRNVKPNRELLYHYTVTVVGVNRPPLDPAGGVWP